MTTKEKYKIASSLARQNKQTVINRLKELTTDVNSGLKLIEQIAPKYKFRNGFIPREVLEIITT